MKNVTEIHTRSFVTFSDLFSGLPKARVEYAEASEYTWGDKPHSLVDPESILATLEFMDSDSDSDSEIVEAIKRLQALPQDVFVDLEN